MNVTSGTIEDSPWVGVVPQEEDDGRDEEENSRGRRRRFVSCTDWTLHRMVQGFLVVDTLASLFSLAYGLALLLQKSPHDNNNHPKLHFPWAAILCLESAAWLGFRALTVVGSLYYSHIVDRVGLWLASHISAWASFQAVVLCLMTVAFRHHLQHATWWNEHFSIHCWSKLFGNKSSVATQEWFLDKIVPWLWLLFLITALLEFPVRWSLYQQYRWRLLQQEEDDLRQTAIVSRMDARRRPWWWGSATTTRSAVDRRTGQVNDLQRALLEDQTRDVEATRVDARNISANNNNNSNNNGLPNWARDSGSPNRMRSSNNPKSSSMFSSLFFWRTTSSDDHDPRDDGSVDFASVQEEWASRSEQDPLWWSRDKPKRPPTSSNQQQQEPARIPDFVSADNDGASTVLSTMGLDTDSVSAQSGR
mmetsp:Transcript_7870/g.16421  ORF Transcript_7870/g.16421 Transcript_7870/m.16421 type:complete len:419 (+) Transcript_7870:233-1489(+)|eukprot:CAMPEP_0168747664 /NCGR_PEP_ID=MMETSP0724-20121128/15775_1 /TAXON_ID=265536 /ORGANISM="Amphiprora sp., Strain CCMP467" /LENGTH=418 /DNA_ID=CAMNT_0008795465 /DNA_START=192 /DNA_END=1448 /DNA_ORIENTATION=+